MSNITAIPVVRISKREARELLLRIDTLQPTWPERLDYQGCVLMGLRGRLSHRRRENPRRGVLASQGLPRRRRRPRWTGHPLRSVLTGPCRRGHVLARHRDGGRRSRPDRCDRIGGPHPRADTGSSDPGRGGTPSPHGHDRLVGRHAKPCTRVHVDGPTLGPRDSSRWTYGRRVPGRPCRQGSPVNVDATKADNPWPVKAPSPEAFDRPPSPTMVRLSPALGARNSLLSTIAIPVITISRREGMGVLDVLLRRSQNSSSTRAAWSWACAAGCRSVGDRSRP